MTKHTDPASHLEKAYSDLKDCLDECLGADGADAVAKLKESKDCALETLRKVQSQKSEAPVEKNAEQK